MARNKQASYAKRKREQARQAKAAEKRAKRRARSEGRSDRGSGPMMAETSPQMNKPTDDEVQRAIERAMNPGKFRASRQAQESGSTKLFVGNVDYGAEEHELKALFSKEGFDVVSTHVARDRQTGASRGFAFVELASPMQAQEALRKMDGTEMNGLALRVNLADR